MSNVTRRDFIKKSAFFGGAAAIAMATPAGVFGFQAAQAAAADDGDVGLVNFAYTLENVAVAAYKAAAGTNLLPKAVLDVGLRFAGQHADHAAALGAAYKQLTGKDATPPPGPFAFPALKNVNDILTFAKALEEAAVGAYYGASSMLKAPALQQAITSIMGVESMHVTVLASALSMNPFPTAFVVGTPFADVQKTATALLATSGQAGQGGGMPAAMPATGMGGAAHKDDFTGTILGVLGGLSAAGAVALAMSKKNSQSEANNTQE